MRAEISVPPGRKTVRRLRTKHTDGYKMRGRFLLLTRRNVCNVCIHYLCKAEVRKLRLEVARKQDIARFHVTVYALGFAILVHGSKQTMKWTWLTTG